MAGLLAGQFFRWRCVQRVNAQGEDAGHDGHSHGSGIDGFRAAKEGVDNSSDGWAGDGCDLKSAGIPGDRVREVFFGNQLRQDGPAHGKVETAEHTEQHEDNVDRMHGMRRTPTDCEQQGRAQAEAGVATHQQLAAVVEIGGVSGEKKQHEAG